MKTKILKQKPQKLKSTIQLRCKIFALISYPGLEELVVHLKQTWKLNSNLLHGEGHETHIPV